MGEDKDAKSGEDYMMLVIKKRYWSQCTFTPHAQNLPASCQSLQAAFRFAYVDEGYAVTQLHKTKE